MEFILFVLTALFFVLWLSSSGKNKSNETIDYNSKSYAQGYWDGHRAGRKELNNESPIDANENDDSNPINEPIGFVDSPSLASEDSDRIELSADESRKIQKSNSLQNINIALYVASFLLVAAAALFVGATLPESVRFVGVWAVALSFYGVGLYLHKNVPKLHPAATAFVGTGLAILPFTGIAMYNLILPDASLCWFVTSVIGVLAFAFAAVRLKSQVVAYLTIAFMISMATSSVATLGAGLIWYFVVLICFGSLITIVAAIKLAIVPGYFAKPIDRVEQWIVPLTMIASLFAIGNLILRDYWIITLVSTVYYVAIAFSSKGQAKDSAQFLTRFLSSLSVVLITYDLTNSFIATSLILSVIGVVQSVVSSFMIDKLDSSINSNTVWLWLGFVLQLLSPIMLLGNDNWDYVALIQLMMMLISSVGVSFVVRNVKLLSFGIFSLALLPMLVGFYIIEPALKAQSVALVYSLFGVLALVICFIDNIKTKHPMFCVTLVVGLVVFIVESLLLSIDAEVSFSFAIWLIASALIYGLAYHQKLPGLVILANLLLIVSTGLFVNLMNISSDWLLLFVSWIAFMVFYGSYLMLNKLLNKKYSLYFWCSAVVVFCLFNLIKLITSFAAVTADAGLITQFAVANLTVVSLIMVNKGIVIKKYILVDAGVIVFTIALQRLIGLYNPDLDMLVYTHWWAIVIGSLSYYYYKIDLKDQSLVRTIIALFLVSFFTGVKAISTGFNYYYVDSSSTYRLVFLIEHVIILLAGLLNSRKLFTIWGAVGVALAILWMLAGYTYLILALAAFVIIGIVIYYLSKQSKI